MDYFRQRYREGFINTKTYEKMIEVLHHLDEKKYIFVETLGEGSFGYVLKIKHSPTEKEYAVKIVSEEYVSEGEKTIWSTLQHKHVLPLLSCDYVYFAKSYVFITPVHPTTLEKQLFEMSFINNLYAFNYVTYWLKQSLAAVGYLHSKDLAHLDIKCNNVLISEDKNAILTDFGFLTCCKKPVQRCGAPLLYRCPEGWMTEMGFPEVDGMKFDIWSIGMLAFEMFTKMSLATELSNLNCPLHSWKDQIYPVIQKNLQKCRFTHLMRGAFPNSNKLDEKVDCIIDFIKSCLTIIPENRPNIHLLQEHELFGGPFKNIQRENCDDTWCNTIEVPECQHSYELNRICNNTYPISNDKDKNNVKVDPFIPNNATYTISENGEIANGFSLEGSAEKSNFDTEFQSPENSFQQLNRNHTESSSNISDNVIISDSESENTKYTLLPTRLQKFKKWLNIRKRAFVRYFFVCVPGSK